LRREVDATTLDLAVQEVRVGTEEDGGGGEDPGQDGTGLATAQSGGGASASSDCSASGLETGKDVVDVVATPVVLVVDVHVLLACGGLFDALFAKLGDFVVLVVVVVVTVVVLVLVVVVVILVDLLTGDALVADDGFGREGKGLSVVVGSPDAVVGTVDATLIVEDSEVDGLAVLGGAVGADVVLAVETVGIVVVVVSVLVVIVVVVVLVFHF